MSAELKQLFHSPDELSDQELDVLRVKLQNMRRVPKLGAAFGFLGAAAFESVALKRNPTVLMLGLGATAGYAFGGYGASNITSNILSRSFDYDILIAQEVRQQARTMNIAGYGNGNYISSKDNNGNRSFDKPY